MHMKKLVLFFVATIALTGCRILNPSRMLKTPKNYQYADIKDSMKTLEYSISANDIIEFRLYSNDGFKLTDVTSAPITTTQQNVNQGVLQYPVDIEGYSKLPVLGRTLLKGMTIRQAEKQLEEKYSLYYIKPFIMIKVVSRRVIVFPGEFGASKVIPLDHENTTPFEALALAGGIAIDGKAYEIKLIRRKPDKTEVFHIDLSTINGLNEGNIVLQANDVIYVENRLRVTSAVVNELAPFFTVLSSVLVIYELGLLIK